MTSGYSFAMNTSTLTIRLPVEQREALKRCAEALKKTESEYIRDLLQRDLDARPLGERVGHLIGCLDSSKLESSDADRLRETIRSNNWRPA
jgi:Arc/MetJ-type ribon-helix-helix transcriptional regulator